MLRKSLISLLLVSAAIPAFAAPGDTPSRVLGGRDLFALEVATDPQISPARAPMIVEIHVGPATACGPTFATDIQLYAATAGYAVLQIKDVPTALVKVPGASHGDFTARPSQSAAKAAAIIAWFDKYRTKPKP